VDDELDIEARLETGEDKSEKELRQLCAGLLVNLEKILPHSMTYLDSSARGYNSARSGRCHTGKHKEEFHSAEYEGPYVFTDGEKEIEAYLEAVPNLNGRDDMLGIYAHLKVINIEDEELSNNGEELAEDIERCLDAGSYEYSVV
jgi:hypothetical protein